jgi:gluconokinase
MKYPKSPQEKVGGIVYFGRMAEKIRLHSIGELHPDLHANLGKGFDERCVNFLGVGYEALRERTLAGLNDEQALEWCFANGQQPTGEQIEVWNDFMRKRGWNDELSEILARRIKENGFENRTDIHTMFDYINADEGRL